MTWTYNETLPTEKDVVRALVGDVDSSDPLASDEFIASYLAGGTLAQTTLRLAAAEVAIAISGRLISRANSISEGGASVNWGDRAKAFRDLAGLLRDADAVLDADGLFDIAEQAFSPFGTREILRNAAIREAI